VQHPKRIGDHTTMMVMIALLESGVDVYMPFGENTRADLIVDNGQRLSKIQCKTGRLRDGRVIFRPCSTYGHHRSAKTTRRSYQGEIDEFGVYCPELGRVYLIPIEEIPNDSQASLRVSPARNGQAKGIRLAALYEIARIDVY
jgi:hypothetical protein